MRAHHFFMPSFLTLLVLVSAPLAPAASQTVASTPDTLPELITRQTRLPQDYPWEAVQRNEQGVVAVQYVVDEKGDVAECTIETSSGFARLDAAACPIVRRWKFKPATLDGKPTSILLADSIPFFLANVVAPGDIEDNSLLLSDPGPEDPAPGTWDPSFNIQDKAPASDRLELKDPYKDGILKGR
jgi:TonB family protein